MSSEILKIDDLLKKARALYIINETGLLEHYEYFVDSDEDPDLYSALFATVHLYAQQLGGGNMELISLENHKFVFANIEDKLIVLDVDLSLNRQNALWLISQIVDRFEQMAQLLEKDPNGEVVLQTLFGERGKSISWNMIREIKEEALNEKLKTSDIVTTTNMTKITVKSNNWVKARQIITKIVTLQKDLYGLLFFVKKGDDINFLFSGRKSPEKLNNLTQYCIQALSDPMGGISLEPEYEIFNGAECAIYPGLVYEGSIIAIAGENKIDIKRIGNQIERVVTAIEKIFST